MRWLPRLAQKPCQPQSRVSLRSSLVLEVRPSLVNDDL